jgi:tetratricopeptide (TPR) repeat protein
MKMSKTVAAVLLVFAGACGGSSASSKRDLDSQASKAPPPPSGAAKIDRDVSGEAQKDFTRAVAFYQEKARAGWNRDACNEAARRFEAVADAHNKMVEARYNAGLSYQNCRMFKEAESQYQAALAIQAGHAPSLSNLGQIYFQGGNEARARQYWEKAVQADAKVAAARNNLAWLMIRQVREKRAQLRDQEDKILAHLRSVLAVENDNIEAYVLLSLLYMEGSDKNKSRLTLAKLLLDKAREFGDKFAPLYNARGLLELRNDNVAQALEEFQQAVALDGGFIEARMNVGNIVLGFRKYEEAAQQFNAVLKMQPKNYDAIVGLGIAQRGLKQLDQAEQSYKKGADVDSARPEAYFNMGVLYKDFRANETQDLRAAQGHYRTAIKYFQLAAARPNVDGELQRETRDNISDCEKNLRSLDDALRQPSQPEGGKSARRGANK